MNQGRIWCVVNPTVGLPLFLGSVTLIALGVHAAVLTNTTWYGAYWQGAAKGKVALNDSEPRVAAASKGESPFSITVTPVAATEGKSAASFVVTVAPKTATMAYSEPVAGDPTNPGTVPIRQANAN